ncbi:secreted PhoX family phosphatase [Saccharopolyspora lacisalsi]|uniref:Secreted PhoX family phosphatase n=1 Tax=Halosaccharopolyspora lacisalsi TaxID=1000566 RepID=A0A839DXA1_9PSEU|nr:secreted PhoX family phosphatase [Halosaccharopolyspora lacisalsi]
MTCEETERRTGEAGDTKDHGFVFEVDPYHPERNQNPRPLTFLGRYSHEALAVDPTSGAIYVKPWCNASNSGLRCS